MRVRDIMRKPAANCTPDMNLAAACELLKKYRCGSLPVVGEGGNVIGMITDRDICVALGTRDEKPSQILVDEVMPARLFTCAPEDEVQCALKTIRRQKIRRLPVIDGSGVLRGILCMDDIVAAAKPHAGKHEISFDDVVETYQSICERLLPGLTRRAAAA